MYVNALKKYIRVDIYGESAPLKCPKAVDSFGLNELSKCAEDMIDKKYKFYIAFENSVCIDYVTEKFFHRRDLNSVPIVLSRRIAQLLFPPNSFIAADDFPEDPKQLAEYLKYLDKNDTAYLEYFRWKPIGYSAVNHDPKTGLQFGFCGLSEKLLRLDQEIREESKVTSLSRLGGAKRRLAAVIWCQNCSRKNGKQILF